MNIPKVNIPIDNDIILDNTKAFWKLDVDKRLSFWSTGFIKLIGYEVESIYVSLDYFLQYLIHENDRNLFRDNFYGFIENNITFKQVIRVLSKRNDYQEFKAKTCNKDPKHPHFKKIVFDNVKIKTPKKLKDNHFYYLETAQMTSTGSWYIDFEKRKSYWDRLAKSILGYPEDYIPSLKKAQTYYHPEHFANAKKLFTECAIRGIPFNAEIKMMTYKGKTLWVKAMGKAVYNDKRKIVGVRGAFQNINDRKSKELRLKKTYDVIASQNSKLLNFAHIVSHNLRSHSSNLELIVQLINSFDTIEEKIEMLDQLSNISNSLSNTIEHLNEIVSVQNKAKQKKVSVSFDNTLKHVLQSINQIIVQQNATIISDFSKAEIINYIPAYLDSIILNLLTNAIKYKHPDRNPVIQLQTYKEDNDIYLKVTDNGLGIDLEKYGDKLFGMYKTFHYNDDAVGVGLFITKSQVESLNGKISVRSEVNKGTEFKIKFQNHYCD